MEIKRNGRALHTSVSWEKSQMASSERFAAAHSFTSKQAAMAWAPKPDVDPYGTLRSLVCHVSRLVQGVSEG